VTRVALQTVEREIANFTRAIVMGGDLESLVGELHAPRRAGANCSL